MRSAITVKLAAMPAGQPSTSACTLGLKNSMR
jgi:hypothetical protein